MVQWRPHLDPWTAGLLILALAAWMAVLFRRLARRLDRRRAVLLLVPKGLVLLVLVLGLFEPVVRRERREGRRGTVLAVLDVSSSMDVADDGRFPRAERARRLLGALRDALPPEVQLDVREFDTTVRRAARAAGDRPAAGGLRDTDLGACLAALATGADVSSCAGVFLLTDGGDEVLTRPELPRAPVSVVGIGTDPAGWNDAAIEAVDCPASAEKDVDFEAAVDLRARGAAPGFLARLAKTRVLLEEETAEGAWKRREQREADLSRGVATVRFRLSSAEPGLRRYRVSLPPAPGELSDLNNARILTVEVRRKSIHVLFFTRELGMDFKMIRDELARDPGVAFTGLFRTIGERFTVQGEAPVETGTLEKGLPADESALRPFDVIVLGSFPAADFSAAQQQALARYVEQGGALVALGGPDSFGLGGYANTPLAALLPWTVSAGEPPFAVGEFAVSVPAAGAGHPVMAGVAEALAAGAGQLESANRPGPLKPAATPLLRATVERQAVDVAAVQPYGRGRVLAFASNTGWRWARRNESLRTAYGRFWRQVVRHLSGQAEGGQVLGVTWDKEAYRPGETALADIRVHAPKAAGQVRLDARLVSPAGPSALAATPVQGLGDAWRVRVPFRERGDYTFALQALAGDTTAETYEKRFRIASLVPEGAHLEVDREFLTGLAEATGGRFWPESAAEEFLREVRRGFWQKSVTVDAPLLQSGPGVLIAFLSVLMLEWVLRRMMNLF